MKLDKEQLIKNRFWYLLGAYALLMGICYLAVSCAGSGRAAEEEKLKKAQAAINSVKGKQITNDSFCEPWRQFGSNFQGQKDRAHKEAWNVQKDLLVFGMNSIDSRWKKSSSFEDWVGSCDPNADDVGRDLSYYVRTNGSYLEQFKNLEPRLIRDNARPDDGVLFPAEYRSARDTQNPMNGGRPGSEQPKEVAPRLQRDGFDYMMAPAVEEGGGPVQSRSIVGFWSRGQPSVEELFLAQEDFSIKRELLQCLRRSMDGVARMEPGPSGFWQTGAVQEPATPADNTVRRVFHNANWELVLIWNRSRNGGWELSKKSTIKNVSTTGRSLNQFNQTTRGSLEFALIQDGPAKDKTIGLKGERLSWGKEVEFGDSLEKNAVGVDPTKPFTVEQVFDWYTSPVRRLDEIRIPALSHRMAHVPLKSHPGFKTEAERNAEKEGQQPEGGPRSKTDGPNGLAINRYLSVTDESRHLPFCLVVVVDQSNVEDVVTALLNSPLRIQIMQVSYARVHGLKSQLTPPPVTTTTGGMTNQQPPQQVDDGDQNLVELTIYGVAALYKRYTPR
jgi:hypothetical protein